MSVNTMDRSLPTSLQLYQRRWKVRQIVEILVQGDLHIRRTRETMLWRKNFKFLKVSWPTYIPVRLPVGEDAWNHSTTLCSVDMTKEEQWVVKGTPIMYYTYKTQFSSGLVRASRLFQQYLVDRYCIVDGKMLKLVHLKPEKRCDAELRRH